MRVKKFKEALAAVRQGREKYLEDAIKNRMQGKNVTLQDLGHEVDSDSDDACILDEADL